MKTWKGKSEYWEKKEKSIWFQNLFMSLGEKGFYETYNDKYIYGKRKKKDKDTKGIHV